MALTHSNKLLQHTRAALVLMVVLAALGVSLAAGTQIERACAQEPLDTTREISVTLDTTNSSPDIVDASFRLYKVADTSPSIELSITPDFQAYPISFERLDDDGYQALALTLAGYVARDNIAAVAQGSTDASGKLTFGTSTTPMYAGMYLLVGESVSTKNATYIHKPTLLFLPAQTEDKASWNYEATINPKYDVVQSPTTSFVVQKVWKDSGNKSVRPQSITVDVMCDNVVYDSAELNEQNAWTKSFDNLDATKNWTVSERSVEGYNVEVRFEDQTYLVENTPVSQPEKPTPVSSKPDQTLPNTGMLIWPIFVFGAAGIILLGVSRFMKGCK